MSNIVGLARNSMALGIGFLVQAVSNSLIIILIARMAGVESLGLYAFIISFISFGIILADFGLPNMITRDVAANPELSKQYISLSLLLTLGLGPFIWALLVIVSIGLSYPFQTVIAIAIAGGMLFFRSLSSVVTAIFDAFQRMELSAMVLIIQEAVALGLLLPILIFSSSFLLIFTALLISRMAGLLSAILIYRKVIGRFEFVWNRNAAINLLRRSFPYAANALAGMIYLQIDILILNYFHGNASSGIYEAAMMLPMRLQAIALVINRALLPAMSRDSQQMPERIKVYCGRSIEYLTIIGAPIVFGSVLIAHSLINLLYGKGYEASVLPFSILMGVVVIRFITSSLAFTLTSIDRQKERTLATCATALVSLIMGLLFIPSYGVMGATLSRTITFVTMFVLMVCYIRRETSVQLRWGILTRIVSASCIMAGVLWIIRAWPVYVSIPVGGIVFGLAAYLLHIFEPGDLQHVRLIWEAARNRISKFKLFS